MNNNQNYNFMATGLNSEMPPDPEQVLNITSLVTAFASNAIKKAEIYVKHAKRNIILAEDLKICMKGETFEFLEKDNSKTIENCRKMIQEDIKKELEGNLTESDSDDFEEDENEIFIKSCCDCDLCVYLNTIDDKWNNWIPQTDLEKSLKKNIDLINM